MWGQETIHQNGINVSRYSARLQTEGGSMKNTRPGTPGNNPAQTEQDVKPMRFYIERVASGLKNKNQSKKHRADRRYIPHGEKG